MVRVNRLSVAVKLELSRRYIFVCRKSSDFGNGVMKEVNGIIYHNLHAEKDDSKIVFLQR